MKVNFSAQRQAHPAFKKIRQTALKNTDKNLISDIIKVMKLNGHPEIETLTILRENVLAFGNRSQAVIKYLDNLIKKSLG